jgi:hypothetical protein
MLRLGKITTGKKAAEEVKQVLRCFEDCISVPYNIKKLRVFHAVTHLKVNEFKDNVKAILIKDITNFYYLNQIEKDSLRKAIFYLDNIMYNSND